MSQRPEVGNFLHKSPTQGSALASLFRGLRHGYKNTNQLVRFGPDFSEFGRLQATIAAEQFQPILNLVGFLGAQLNLGNELAGTARSRSLTVIRSHRGSCPEHLLTRNPQLFPLFMERDKESNNRSTGPFGPRPHLLTFRGAQLLCTQVSHSSLSLLCQPQSLPSVAALFDCFAPRSMVQIPSDRAPDTGFEGLEGFPPQLAG